MKVKDDETAYKVRPNGSPVTCVRLRAATQRCERAQMDLAFDEMIDDLGEVDGCEGASRLVCKSEWDYKFILKFEDLKSLQDYMKNDHDRISEIHLPKIKTLAVHLRRASACMVSFAAPNLCVSAHAGWRHRPAKLRLCAPPVPLLAASKGAPPPEKRKTLGCHGAHGQGCLPPFMCAIEQPA